MKHVVRFGLVILVVGTLPLSVPILCGALVGAYIVRTGRKAMREGQYNGR